MSATQAHPSVIGSDGTSHNPVSYTPFPTPNRQHKDTIFRDLFGSQDRKENTLSLYNALNSSDYTNTDDLVLTTLDNVLYMGVKNDVSFLINDEMILWEHQSTHNPNMPLRGLTYFSILFNRWVERQRESLYAGSRIMLPTPRYFVFFVGESDRPDREVIRLSDSFTQGKGDVEVTVTVLNVNADHNEELMSACRALREYALFVKAVRSYTRTMDLTYAMCAAVDECIRNDILSDYLREKGAKVFEMFAEEYNEAEMLRRVRLSVMREGRSEGRREEHQDILKRLVSEIAAGKLTVQNALDLGFTQQEIDDALARIS